MTKNEESGSAIERFKAWFYRQRKRTRKHYSDMNYVKDVRIYNKTTSPSEIVMSWMLAIIPYGIVAMFAYGLYSTPAPSGPELLLWAFSAGVLALFTLIVLGLTYSQVSGWARRVFGAPEVCEQCGDLTNFPHEFTHKTDVGLSNEQEYAFCSTACRKAWEWEHIEYSFSGYYDIQDEADENHVKQDNYSSAYEVDSDVQ